MTFDLAKLQDELIRDEGLRLRPYVDTVGKTTIGIGRNLTDRGITRDEALILCANDIATAAADLDRNVPWWRSMTPVRQCALVNMCFNLGWSGLSRFVNLLDALKRGDWQTAKVEALDSKWADESDGKLDGNDGSRAIRIATMFEEG